MFYETAEISIVISSIASPQLAHAMRFNLFLMNE